MIPPCFVRNFWNNSFQIRVYVYDPEKMGFEIGHVIEIGVDGVVFDDDYLILAIQINIKFLSHSIQRPRYFNLQIPQIDHQRMIIVNVSSSAKFWIHVKN